MHEQLKIIIPQHDTTATMTGRRKKKLKNRSSAVHRSFILWSEAEPIYYLEEKNRGFVQLNYDGMQEQ